jgi:hypothetical protein
VSYIHASLTASTVTTVGAINTKHNHVKMTNIPWSCSQGFEDTIHKRLTCQDDAVHTLVFTGIECAYVNNMTLRKLDHLLCTIQADPVTSSSQIEYNIIRRVPQAVIVNAVATSQHVFTPYAEEGGQVATFVRQVSSGGICQLSLWNKLFWTSFVSKT